MLNTASRTRSAVGRVASPFGAFKRRPPAVPAMIRMRRVYSTGARGVKLMPMAQRKLTGVLLILAWTSGGCSPPAGTAADGGADLVAGPCQVLTAALQAAVDGARTSPNAIVAASTPACPSLAVASGPAATGNLDSSWRLASVTKTYVSATILSLVKDGKLGLDDLLSKWVPNVQNSAGVTVRMLLNHTSGIFNFNDDPAFSRTVAWTPEQLVQMGTSHAPYFAAGTGFRYSNTDYVLLGLVAEAAGSASLGTLLHRHAIDKAALAATFFSGEDTVATTPARGFDSGADITDTMLSYATWAAGSMVAGGADGARWLRELYATNDVLDPNQQSLLQADAVTVGPGYKYGLGVQIYASFYKGEKAIGHLGDTTGFHTWALYFPNRDLALLVVVNEETAKVDPVGRAALDVLLN
jgi:D-alanyl-D-alanine carboxypeptidase